MPKDRDTYDGRRKATGMPIPDVYKGRRPVRGENVGPIAAQDKRNPAGAIQDKRNPAGAAQSEDNTGGAAQNVKYTPSFDAALIHATKKVNNLSGGPNGPGATGGFGGSGAPDGYSRPGGPAAQGDADRIACELADVLDREDKLYKDAADISKKKTEIIVHGKIEELDSLVKAEQALILKIGKLEDERERVIMALSYALDMDLAAATLSDINPRLTGESYSRLDNCQKSLAQTLGGLKNSNDTNSQLIQNALDYVNFSVNIITTNQNSGNIYSQDGDEEAGRERRSIFDVKL